jgi:hypothetical protein
MRPRAGRAKQNNTTPQKQEDTNENKKKNKSKEGG